MTEQQIHELIEQQDPEAKQRMWAKIQNKLQEKQKAMNGTATQEQSKGTKAGKQTNAAIVDAMEKLKDYFSNLASNGHVIDLLTVIQGITKFTNENYSD